MNLRRICDRTDCRAGHQPERGSGGRRWPRLQRRAADKLIAPPESAAEKLSWPRGAIRTSTGQGSALTAHIRLVLGIFCVFSGQQESRRSAATWGLATAKSSATAPDWGPHCHSRLRCLPGPLVPVAQADQFVALASGSRCQSCGPHSGKSATRPGLVQVIANPV